MQTEQKREIITKHVILLSAYLLLVWGFYRFLFKLPEELEELIVKPVIWLVPVFYFLRKEKESIKSLGLTTKNLFPSIYLALLFGAFFTIEGVVVNVLKYPGGDFSANLGKSAFGVALFLSLATAVSEEFTFRGYLFNRALYLFKSEWKANFITSFIWALIHVPTAIFWWQLDVKGSLGFLALTTIFSIGSAFVYARTKNIASSVLLHILWEWPIILFR